MKKKGLFIIGGIVLLFIITNPSITAFKSFQGKNSYEGLSKPINMFVYSIYEDDVGYRYIGFMGNFWSLNPPSHSHIDSIKVGITTDTAKDPFAKYGGKEIKKH